MAPRSVPFWGERISPFRSLIPYDDSDTGSLSSHDSLLGMSHSWALRHFPLFPASPI